MRILGFRRTKRQKKLGWRVAGLVSVLLAVSSGVLTPIEDTNAAACSEGNDITIAAGTTCEWSAGDHFYTGTLTIAAGAYVTASGTSTDGLAVRVFADNFVINGKISMTGYGADVGNGTSFGVAGPSGGGGANGGNGGRGTETVIAAGGTAYGSATNAQTIGSGGGDDTGTGGIQAGRGGGALRLTVYSTGTLSLGSGAVISASGTDAITNDSGGGGGGSIWLDAPNGTISGPGSGTAFLIANGGHAVSGQSGGGGGGGRIALFYSTFTNGGNINRQAIGGNGGSSAGSPGERGGAGTIFLKDSAATNGDLTVHNGNRSGGVDTPQTTSAADVFDNLTVSGGASYLIPSGSSTTIASGGAFAGGGTVLATLKVDGTFDPSVESASFNAVNVTHNGDVASVRYLTFNNGTYVFNTSGATYSNNPGQRLRTLVVSATTSAGTYSTSGSSTFYVDLLTIKSGAFMTHEDNADYQAHSLFVSATTSILVEGTVGVGGKGYANGQGLGAGGASSNAGAGGAYGGDGGKGSGVMALIGYGSIRQPTHLGSGGGDDGNDTVTGGDGGGAIKLFAPLVTLAGGSLVSATGTNANGGTSTEAGGGAGGSIWIDADTIAGTGTLNANGGFAQATGNGAGGSGGRIAVYYGSGTIGNWTILNAGGSRGSAGGTQQPGAAGTTFLKQDSAPNGDLRVSNANRTGTVPSTRTRSTSETFDNLTVSASAQFYVLGGDTVTMASAGSCSSIVGGGTVQAGLTIEGVFNGPNATCTIDDLDVSQTGDFGTLTALTYTNGTYTINTSTSRFPAGTANRLSSLSVGTGATFSTQTTARLALTTLTVNSGGTLTHDDNTTTMANKLFVSATSSITVNAGGAISASGKGYDGGEGPGEGAANSVEGAGGGHCGDGGDTEDAIAGGISYDQVVAPTDGGSGGGNDANDSVSGGSGGGAIRLTAQASIAINAGGSVVSDGDTGSLDAGSGAGGSIWIDAPSLTGAGTVTVNSATATASNNGGGGGGGCLAIYHSGTLPGWLIRALGGARGTASGTQENGGAGTVFIFDRDSAVNGELRVRNATTFTTTQAYTTMSTSSTQAFDAVTINDNARYRIPPSFTLDMSSGAFSGGGSLQGTLIIDGALQDGATTTIDDVDVEHNGDVAGLTSLEYRNGTYTVDTITSRFTAGSGNRLGTLTLNNSGIFATKYADTFYADAFNIQSGGTLTHVENGATHQHSLIISATSSIDIDAGGFIDVDGRGFDGQSGDGAGTTGGSGGGGGGHGGKGGHNASWANPGGHVYGSPTQPTTLGSGSGDTTSIGSDQSAPGGGAVKITVNAGGTFVNDGTISANGGESSSNPDYAAGAGGSVWIQIPNIDPTGTGTITANGSGNIVGSCGGGGGGGGRVALYYGSSLPAWTVTAYGGDECVGGTSNGEHGGAGTIYTKSSSQTNGALVIDNDNLYSRWPGTTTQATSTSQTYDAVTIRGSAVYDVPEGTTLTIASGGSLTGTSGGDPDGTLLVRGSFVPPSTTFSASFIDIDHRGTIGPVTALTHATGTYMIDTTRALFSGGQGKGIDALTIESGSRLVQSTSGTLFAGTLAVNRGGVLTHASNTSSHAHSLIVSATTSITVNAGGRVDAAEAGFTDATGVWPGGSGSTAGGGAYGGAGGSSTVTSGGEPYGSAVSPAHLGSAGGDDTSTGGTDDSGAGGGYIKLSTPEDGSMTIDGTVSADGMAGPNVDAGGGAGGTVWLITGTFFSSANITANGGAGASANAGCGGGGRIKISYTSFTTSATTTADPGCTGARGGGYGSVYIQQSGSPPVVTSVTHSPDPAEVGNDVILFGTATDDVGIQKIEIYLDGTGPGNLERTCTFSPVETPADCQVNVGTLSAGSHTSYVKAYDNLNATNTVSENFSVADRTGSNVLSFTTNKAGASGTFGLSFTLSATSTGTLEVTFPAGFTVTAAATTGSGCLSGFAFSASTLTATKTECAGTVSMQGATVTNPSAPGTYVVTWTNDNGWGSVYISSDDQFTIDATVDPILTFNVGAQAAATACDGTFTGDGGSVDLGTLTTASVASSDASSVPHICMRASTNATHGAVVSVRSANAALASIATPADTIPSVTATLTAGTAGYGLCAGSAGADSGKDATTPVGATPLRATPFDGSCTSGTHAVGALTTSRQNLWSVSGPVQNAFFRIYVKAAVSGITVPHLDYADTLTFTIVATY